MKSYYTERILRNISILELEKGVILVLVLQFFVNFSVFASFPMLVLYLQEQGALSNSEIATVTSVNLLAARLLPILIGGIVDLLSARIVVAVALVLRGASFFGLVWVSNIWAFLFVSVVNGLGAALYETAAYGIIGSAPDEKKARIFYLNSLFLNAGALLGPTVLMVFPVNDLSFSFQISGSFFLISSFSALFIGIQTASKSKAGYLSSMASVFKNRQFIRLLVLFVPFWTLYMQLYSFFPLQIKLMGVDDYGVRLFYVVNAISGMLFALMAAIFIKSLGWLNLLRSGHLAFFFVFMVGALIFSTSKEAFVNKYLLVALLSVLFTMAETMILPTSDMAVTRLAPSEKQATYFGASSVSWAIGGTIGNFSGTYFGTIAGSNSGWYFFSAIGLIGFFGFYKYRSP